MTAIQKMVEWLEKCESAGPPSQYYISYVLVEARRLALEEAKKAVFIVPCQVNDFDNTGPCPHSNKDGAIPCGYKKKDCPSMIGAKEKPAIDLWGQYKQMVKLAQDHGLNLAANWAVNMSGKTFSEKPTAPPSYEWEYDAAKKCIGFLQVDIGILRRELAKAKELISRYRPTPTDDIVASIREFLNRNRGCDQYDEIEEILRKYEGAK